MNAKQIARIIEVLFQGDPGGEAPEPLNKRFQWKNPATGKAPPRMPKEVIPTEKDMRDLDTEFSVPPGHEGGAVPRHAAPPAGAGAGAGLPDDRTGSVPFSGMIGKGEMATIDDLLDTYLQMQKTQGPAAAKAWFDRYRTAEFESLMRYIADTILEGNEKEWAKHFDAVEKSQAEKAKARQAQAPKRVFSKGPVPKRSTS